MTKAMKGVTLFADWDPKPDFKLGSKDIERKQTYLGSKVWRNPRIEIVDHSIPEPGLDEVLIEVKACGICGSDVHMAQPDDEGYILYPGLTGFPCILGHELAGIVVNKDNSLLQNPYIRNLLQLAVNTAKTGKVLDNKAPATIFWHYFGGATLVNSLRASLSNPQYSTMYQQNKNEIAVLLEGDFSADGLLRLKGKKVADLNLIFPEEPNIEAACQSYAQLARQQGLRLNLIALNEDEYTERLNKGEYDLCYVCAADRLDTPYSLAQEFLSHIGGGEIENLSPEKPDNEGQTLALDLAASINTDQFTKAARACFQYSLTKMYYYPLGYGTINNVYLKSDYWDNIFDYWTLSLDNRDLTGIGASDILDSISTKAKD